MSKLSYYRDTLGFDQSKRVPFTKQYRIRCSCCEALVINNTPTHERGCPNAMHECDGCNTIIPQGAKYCTDCWTH